MPTIVVIFFAIINLIVAVVVTGLVIVSNQLSKYKQGKTSIDINQLEKIKAGELDPQRAARLREKMPGKIEKEPWRYLMVDNGHPNRWGHEIIAEKIMEKARGMNRFRELCLKGDIE